MKIDLPDVVALAGLLTAAAGVWMIYPPAALIVLGVGLMVGGLVAAAPRPGRAD